jgi:uncharacterized cupredoxin-like copper-binding protein
MKIAPVVAALAAVAVSLPAALAHEGEPREPRAPDGVRHAWGTAGDPAKATRRIRVTMHDTMRYTPSALRVRRGETVTFVVRNAGRVMHEFVIGTPAGLAAHAEAMKRHPGMEHDEPYMAHVPPGQTRRITWTFSEGGNFLAGCLVPGHWEAGMKAELNVDDSEGAKR